MNAQPIGLRERKHTETRHHLEEAAVALVCKEGLDKTTVDAISDAANVSSRTFFNYFDTKEDAILGVYTTNKNDTENSNTVQFQREDDIITSVVDLLLDLIDSSKDMRQLHKKRTKLIRQYPALLEKQISRITKINDEVKTKVKEMILVKYAELDTMSAEARSEIIVMACAGGVRIATKEWLSSNTGTLTSDVRQQAVILIKNTLKAL